LRIVTVERVGFVNGVTYRFHDRDTRFGENFRQLICAGGVQSLVRPARSPNLNALVECWIRATKNECLDKLIVFGRASAERAWKAYVGHYHAERYHLGIGNVMPRAEGGVGREEGGIVRMRSLGGLLSVHVRRAG
jgi:putative transposase